MLLSLLALKKIKKMMMVLMTIEYLKLFFVAFSDVFVLTSREKVLQSNKSFFIFLNIIFLSSFLSKFFI